MIKLFGYCLIALAILSASDKLVECYLKAHGWTECGKGGIFSQTKWCSPKERVKELEELLTEQFERVKKEGDSK